jgi:hypothetical protein
LRASRYHFSVTTIVKDCAFSLAKYFLGNKKSVGENILLLVQLKKDLLLGSNCKFVKGAAIFLPSGPMLRTFVPTAAATQKEEVEWPDTHLNASLNWFSFHVN